MSNRVRLTTRGYNPKTAAFGKKAEPADVYKMNQETSNPKMDAYAKGDPSAWAEDVDDSNWWKKEYSVGRNEVGLPKPLSKSARAEKIAQFKTAKKTAVQSLRLATAIFPDANEDFLNHTARDFMNMGESSLNAVIARIIQAAEEAEECETDEEVAPEAPAKEEPKAEESDSKTAKVASLKKKLATIKASPQSKKYASIVTALEGQISDLQKTAEECDAEEDSSEESEEESKVASNLIALRKEIRKMAEEMAAEAPAKEEEAPEEEEMDAEPVKQATVSKSAKNKRADDAPPFAKAEESDEGSEETEEEAPEAEEAPVEKESYDIEFNEVDSMLMASDDDLLDNIFTANENKKVANKSGVKKLSGLKVASRNSSKEDLLSSFWRRDPDISGDLR
jgi:hypothetical protein